MKTFRMGKLGWVLGGVAALSGAIVGCGSDFSGDCQLSRTCPDTGGSAGTGASAAGAGAGEQPEPEPEPGEAGGGNASPPAPAEAGAGGAPAGGGADNGGAAGSPEPVNPAPYVTSITPLDGTTGVETNSTVTIELSEPLAAETVNSTSVHLLFGDREVVGTVTYADSHIVFTPKQPLALLGSYKVSVSTGVTALDGAPLASSFESTFTVRDGAWKTVDAASGKLTLLSDALSLTDSGDALLAWSGSAGSSCPVVARWFNRGVAQPAKPLTADGLASCDEVTSAGNASGVAAVAWLVKGLDGALSAQQYRSSTWLPKAGTVVADNGAYFFRVSVAPSGTISAFENNYSTGINVQIAGNGTWGKTANLSKLPSSSRPSVAFDSKSNGLALWRAIDDYGLPQIFASRLTQPAGTWGAATTLPPTVGAPGDTELGIPAVAFDAAGGAIAIWFDKKSAVIRASRYQSASGWDSPLAISGAETVSILDEAPGLVFDGKDFVAAWTAESGGKLYVYTARYTANSGWDVPQRRQTAAADGFSASHMPRLGSDGRGNLLLIWAKGTAPNFSLVYQRFTGGTWTGIQEILGGGIKSSIFESAQALPFALNPDGLGAVAWGNYDGTTLTAVRLASFF